MRSLVIAVLAVHAAGASFLLSTLERPSCSVSRSRQPRAEAQQGPTRPVRKGVHLPSLQQQQQRPDDDGFALGPNDDDGFVFGRASIEATISALRNGSLVLMTEDGGEVTRGLLVGAPSLVSPEQLGFMLAHGVRLQAALEPESYRALYRSLHHIVLDNNDLAHPALSVSAAGAGRSPRNALHIVETVRALSQTDWEAAAAAGRSGDDQSPEWLVCPGAVSVAASLEGGVLRRAGATEASVDLAKAAGLPPVGLQAHLLSSSLDELLRFAAQHGIPHSSTADLVAFSRRRSRLIERSAPPVVMPTRFGRFVAHCYRSKIDGIEHMALVKCESAAHVRQKGEGEHELPPFGGSSRPALVRVHSECCTGDIFGSLRCDCGPQLEKALEMIELDGHGCLLYLRGQEGRGIGLGAKMHAYALQERGVDTLDANLELGLPVDSREYGTGAQILADLGITDMRLMSNNPKKFTGLAGFGLRIVARVPSHTTPNPENIKYLQTKLERMGHMLGQLDGGADLPAAGGEEAAGSDDAIVADGGE
uniref:GTP cyclohydrolase II n=1 Tax=Calcidiscus leptoporus TaxID=127549 RepID=A0A7S0IWT2_9EUKA|mmetsp:Transcript_26593/g.62099  ORF Transcript_26593/g.62099 Transcript_26593/m.62099 type:complete len:535 (+) Transcript_26593:31-1635(+)